MKNDPDKLFYQLLDRLRAISSFGYSGDISQWDQLTKMPKGETEGRAEITATIRTEWHKRFVSPRIGKPLERLIDMEEELPRNHWFIVKRLHAIHQRAKAIPPPFYRKFIKFTSQAYEVWVRARKESDFKSFQFHLEEIVKFMSHFADLFGYEKNPYDALLPDHEPGMVTDRLIQIFSALETKLVPFVRKLTEQSDKPDETLLKGHFPEELQRKLCTQALQAIGYDFGRGRLDTTVHPFTTSVGPNDVRVTTHFKHWNLSPSLFSTLHEGGHAIFEQNQDPTLRWIYLDTGFSHGLHESQSRFFENIIGRSLPFWKLFYWQLQNIFPYYKEIPLEEFYRAINAVKTSLIRIYADEVTYNLHIIVRFEIEEALLNNRIDVSDLPQVWNEKMDQYLNLVPPNDALGVLQDVHWSGGSFAYFPSYSLGNLYGGQIREELMRQMPRVEDELAKGNVAIILEWLRKNIHRFGKIREAPELLEAITGERPTPEPWLRYIKSKFSRIYDLN